MKRAMIAALASVAAFTALPAHAVIIPDGSSGLIFTPFDGSTQGNLLASTTVSGTALTFAATMRSAVYRNTLGTLDFYYQVVRTGPGSFSSQMIDRFTASDFGGFIVDGFVSAVDPDGGGFFTAVNNPPASTTTTGRNATGIVLQTSFGLNGLNGTENSATYIFRTNATTFKQGTFGIIDGSTLDGIAFAPNAVPEPAAWGLMIGGLGLVGAALRRRKGRMTTVLA
jgi:PEP-CTERM motif